MVLSHPVGHWKAVPDVFDAAAAESRGSGNNPRHAWPGEVSHGVNAEAIHESPAEAGWVAGSADTDDGQLTLVNCKVSIDGQ